MSKDTKKLKDINEYKSAKKLAEQYLSSFDDSKYFDFIYGKNRNLLTEISNGSEMIPSPLFFNGVSKLGICDSGRKNCSFASTLTAEYYINVFNAGLKYKDNFKEFSREFEKVSQPIGRKLINYILLMRLHILDREFDEQNKKLMKILNKIAIKMTSLFIADPKKAELIYTWISIGTISLISLGCFFVVGGFDSLFTSILSSLSTALAGIMVSLSVHRFNSFEHTDISGKNLLALKYKSLFIHEFTNFLKKKKIYSSSKEAANINLETTDIVKEEKLFEMA